MDQYIHFLSFYPHDSILFWPVVEFELTALYEIIFLSQLWLLLTYLSYDPRILVRCFLFASTSILHLSSVK